jgi:hypothetical protein
MGCNGSPGCALRAGGFCTARPCGAQSRCKFRTAWPSRAESQIEVSPAAELTTRREFWSRIDRGDVRFVFVAVLKSWRWIADHVGEEGVDIAGEWFLDLCRFATADAAVEARLSHTVFAAYWPAIVDQSHVDDVMRRWVPMEVKTPIATMPIDAAWFMFEVSPGHEARDLFDRMSAAIDEAMQSVPERDRHEPLSRGWDGQVG